MSLRSGIITTLIGLAMLGCSVGQSRSNTAFAKGQPAPQQYFTGHVWLQMLHTNTDPALDAQVYNVTFEARARTHWHSHPGGQILMITSGLCYYQEKGKPARILKPGEVVAAAPNVLHWHGASPNTEMAHLGISTQVHLGSVQWKGPVTDEQYATVQDQ